MLTALALALLPPTADPLEIPDTTPLGSARTIGLAGAVTATPDDPITAWINPAAVAPVDGEGPLQVTVSGWFSPTVRLLVPGAEGAGGGLIGDVCTELARLDHTQDADRTGALVGGVTYNTDVVGVSLNVRHENYRAPVDRDPAALRTEDTQISASIGGPDPVRWGVGLLGHTDRVCVGGDDDGCEMAGRSYGMATLAGIAAEPVRDRLRIGLSGRSASTVLPIPSPTRPVRLPWSLGAGLAVQAGPPGTWWSADLRLTPPSPSASTIAHPDQRGLPATLQVAGGVEYLLTDAVTLRHGAYLEPGRDRTVSARPHLTGGIDVRLDEPVLEVFTGLTAAADWAPPGEGPAYLALVLAPLVTIPEEIWPWLPR